MQHERVRLYFDQLNIIDILIRKTYQVQIFNGKEDCLV